MTHSFIIVAAFAWALQVGAERGTDDKIVEVSARSHFVAKKGGAVLADVAEHHPKMQAQNAKMHPKMQARHLAMHQHKTGHASKPIASHRSAEAEAPMSPDMRAKVTVFSKLAVQALSAGVNPTINKAKKSRIVNAALDGAKNAMSSLAETDMARNPGLAFQFTRLKDFASSASKIQQEPSFIQERQGEDHRSAAVSVAAIKEEPSAKRRSKRPMTPEIRAQVLAFSAAAEKALALRNDPSLNEEDKAKAVEAALAEAKNTLSSLTDMKKQPVIEQRFADMGEVYNSVSAPAAMLQKSQKGKIENRPPASKDGQKLTAEQKAEVKSFRQAALKAISDARDPSLTADQKMAAVKRALDTSVHTMSVMRPELATRETYWQKIQDLAKEANIPE